MPNVFINDSSPAVGATFLLSPEESHHLVAVLRIKKEGTPITLFNGQHQAWAGTLLEANPKKTSLYIKEEKNVPFKPYTLHLVQALPKGKVMEDVIRKAVEIGVTHLHPITTEHTEVHLKGDRADKKRERWECVAIEACKQSGNLQVPLLSSLQSIDKFLNTLDSKESLLCVASLESQTQLLSQALSRTEAKHIKHIYWLIGPEGDFSPAEYALIKENGFRGIRLADHVLKVETAATYALSVTDFWMKS